EHQIIVNPDNQGVAKARPLTPAAAKAAMAAGVKNAALIHVIPTKKPAQSPPAPVKVSDWEKVSFTAHDAKPAAGAKTDGPAPPAAAAGAAAKPVPTAKPVPRRVVHRKAKPKARRKKATPKAAVKSAVPSEPAAKPSVKSTAKPAATMARPAGKKKPSAAIAK